MINEFDILRFPEETKPRRTAEDKNEMTPGIDLHELKIELRLQEAIANPGYCSQQCDCRKTDSCWERNHILYVAAQMPRHRMLSLLYIY